MANKISLNLLIMGNIIVKMKNSYLNNFILDLIMFKGCLC
jgi:hypothetical protein